MSLGKRIVTNTVTKWIWQITEGLTGLLLIRYLLAELGPQAFGLIGLVASVAGLAMLADFGLRMGLSRQLSADVAREDTEGVNCLVSTGFVTYLALGIGVGAVFFVAGPMFVEAMDIPDSYRPQAQFLVRGYIPLFTLLTFMGPVFGGVLESHHRFDLRNLGATLGAIAKGVGIFLAVGFVHKSLYAWAWASLAAVLLKVLFWTIASFRMHPKLRVNPLLFRWSKLWPVLRVGMNVFVLKCTNLIGEQSDPVVITRFVGMESVAFYRPGLLLSSLAREFVTSFSMQLTPMTTGMHVKGERELLRKVLVTGTKYTMLMGAVTSAVLIFLGSSLIDLWLGDRLPENGRYIAAAVLILWSCVDYVNYAGGTQWAVLLGMNRLKVLVIIQVVGAVVNLAASVILVSQTSLGVIGVVIPTLAVALLRRPLLTIYTARACGIPAWSYALGAYLPALAATGLLFAVAALVAFFVSASGFVGLGLSELTSKIVALGLSVVIIGVAWVPLCWFVGFNREDRARFRAMLKGFLARGSRASV